MNRSHRWLYVLVGLILLISPLLALAADPRSPDFTENGTILANSGPLVIPIMESDLSKGWTVAVNSTSSYYVKLVVNDQAIRQSNWSAGASQLFVEPDALATPTAAAIEVWPADASTDLAYSISSTSSPIVDLQWDSGATAAGDAPKAAPDSFGRNYYYRVNTETAASGVWRTTLKVLTGEANLYLTYNYYPNQSGPSYTSENQGDDGITLNTYQYAPGQTWYITVSATPGSTWELVSGAAHVVDLGLVSDLPPDAAKDVTIGPEGLALFRADVGFDTLAWRLKATGTGGNILVKKNSAPTLANGSESAERTLNGEGLLVPTYLTSGVYFVGVRGAPGSKITLDSRNQEIRVPNQQQGFQGVDNFDFTLSNQASDGYGYLTYRLEVPADRIGWQIVCTPVSGDPQLYIRLGNVPNEWNNNGLSESAGAVAESITQVPPSLSAGVWYVTVHGSGAYSFSLKSSAPEVTNVPYENYATPIVNSGASANMAGWRYFAVTDLDSQAGSLAWELELFNYSPGTKISIRRNAIPSEIAYRENDNLYTSRSNYSDVTADSYILHRPHAQDVWYIGVGNESAALGEFTLKTRSAKADALNYANGSATVSGQPADRWTFFKVEVPAEGLGWLIRLTNITSGTPRISIRRGDLPYDLGTQSWPLWGKGEWGIGEQWSAGAGSLSGRDMSSDEKMVIGQSHLLGLGSPLTPGSYYVGVSGAAAGETLNYTIESKGVGVGNDSKGDPWPVQVQDLAFTGGSASVTDLPAQDFAIYRVTVPDASESWAVKLTATRGESLINIRRGQIGNSSYAFPGYWYWYFSNPNSDSPDFFHGMPRVKAGDEYFYKYPGDGATAISSGVYYVTVQSEGENPSDWRHYGAGTADFTVESVGKVPVTQIETPFGVNDSTTYPGLSLAYGEEKVYRFSVAAGVKSLEVLLENSTQGVLAALCAERDGQVGFPTFGIYPHEGGGNCRYMNQSATRINVLAPSGSYTLVVAGNDTVLPASCDLKILAQGDTVLAMNGGSDAVAAQPPYSWKFYRIEVPADAFGWKLSISNVTGGNPHMAVRKGEVPTAANSPAYWMIAGSTWDDGVTYAGEVGDITGRYLDPVTSNVAIGRDFTFGMGSMLSPGLYFVGVYNESPDPASYEILSRGIGFPTDPTDWAIKIADLPFHGGSATVNGLGVRDISVYRVTVPDSAATWALKLSVTAGEAMFNIRKDVLGNSGVMYFPYWYYYVPGPYRCDLPHSFHGTSLTKPGDEYFYKVPTDETGKITAGTYYVTVHAEGSGQLDARYFGTGGSDFTLTSVGEAVVDDATSTPLTIEAPLLFAAQTAHSGENKFYRVRIPAGFSGTEVETKNAAGDPRLSICETYPGIQGFTVENGFYAAVEGAAHCKRTFTGTGLVNISNPDGDYLVRVYGDNAGGADATYDLEVRAVGEAALDFVNGSVTVNGQTAGTWRFFKVVVPQDAMGWRIAIPEVTSGTPVIAVSRDVPPANLLDITPGDLTFYHPTWDSGGQWGQYAGHILNIVYGPGNEFIQGREILLGMGSPLVAGTYVLGIMNHPWFGDTSPMSYRLVSQGIGVGNASDTRPWPLQIEELPFAGGSVNVSDLPAGSEKIYKIAVPQGAKSWELNLTSVLGNTAMNVRRAFLGNSAAKNRYYWQSMDSDSIDHYQGALRDNGGDDYFYKFPRTDENTITAGDYYVTVYSRGGNPIDQSHYGTGDASFELASIGEAPIDDTSANAMTGETPMVRTAELAKWGENRIYRFALPEGAPNLEVVLDNVSGSPRMELCRNALENNVFASSAASVEGGGWCTTRESGYDVLNMQDPTAGVYTLIVYSNSQNTDVEYDIKIGIKIPVALPLVGGTFTGGLRADQIDYFTVDVPETLDGLPVPGMTVTLEEYSGNVTLMAYKELTQGTIQEDVGETVIVPPVLTPGRWYLRVKGATPAQYKVTVNPVTPARVFALAANGGSIARPGLTPPMIGDTGVDETGAPIVNPITQDQGTDIAPGHYHFYLITVPADNGAFIHARLENISGNTNLYLRRGLPPSLSHRLSLTWWDSPAYERTLIGTGTKYASWTPENNRVEAKLTPGDWWIAVHTSEANARYRLKVSSPNVVDANGALMDTFGLVKDLDIAEGQLLNQTVTAGDMRFFKVRVPDVSVDQAASAPISWFVKFSEQAGDVQLFVRGDTPPGNAYDRYAYNDWNSDDTGFSYTSYDAAGTVELTIPPVKPGHLYYLGVYAKSDAVFNIGSTLGTERLKLDGLIDFYGGTASGSLAPGESRLYAVSVPADATRWIHTSIHDPSVTVRIHQETPPPDNTSAHFNSGGVADSYLNTYLLNTYMNGYPWQPGHRYFIKVKNDSTTSQSFSFTFDGRNADTDDNDNDGLPDAWEMKYFGHTGWGPIDDPDADGLDILTERLLGTDPSTFDSDGDGIGDGQDLFPLDPARGAIFAEDVAQLSASSDLARIDFANPHLDPIVIVGPMTALDADPAFVKVANISATGFDVSVSEWNYQDGVHGAESFSYLVFERGRVKLPDGAMWEAGSFQVSGPGGFTKVNFNSQFPDTPFLLTTIQSSPSTMPEVVRLQNVTPYGFDAGVYQEEAQNAAHGPVTVGYVAVYLPSNSTLLVGGNQLAVFGERRYVDSAIADVGYPELLALQEETSLFHENTHAQETVDVLTIGDRLFAQTTTFNETDPIVVRAFTTGHINQWPYIGGYLPSVTLYEGSGYTASPSGAGDPDNEQVIYVIDNMPAWATFNQDSGTLSGTPGNDDVGVSKPIMISAIDPKGAATGLPTFTITVLNVNDAPTISGQPQTTVLAGNHYSFSPVGSDIDKGDTLNYSINLQPSWAYFNPNTGELSGTPVLGDAGTTTGIVITVTDAAGAWASFPAFDLQVILPNVAPTATAMEATLDEDTSKAIVLKAEDLNTNDVLTLSVVDPPSHGTLTGDAPNLTYTPVKDFNGTDSFTFKANDGTLDSEKATVSITVNPVNDAPTAASKQVALDEDTPASVTLTGADIDGDTLSFAVVANPGHGALSGTPPNLTYTPAENFTGADSFTYKASDGIADSAPATVALTVAARNDAPMSLAASLEMAEDGTLAITLTATDVDGDTLTYSVVNQPLQGTLAGNAPNLTYTPAKDFNGADSFTFKANDGSLDSNTATVSLTITPANDAPAADAQSLTVAEDSPLTVTLTGNDVEGDALTFTVVTQPTHGTLTGTAPNLVYTPAKDFNGTDSFTFKANDGSADSTGATVSIAVTPVNDAPAADAKTIETVQDSPVPVTLTGSDVDGDTLTFTLSNAPAHGVVSGDPPEVTYTPEAGYFGADSFGFKAHDGQAYSEVATVSVTVKPGNRPPLLDSIGNRTAEVGTELVITAHATDPDNDTLTYGVGDAPTGSAFDTATGVFSWTPQLNDEGMDYKVTFNVTDNGAPPMGASEQITITVGPYNQPPVLGTVGTNNTVSVQEGATVDFTVPATDPDGVGLTFQIGNKPLGADFDTATGKFTWVTGYSDYGTYIVTVTVFDNGSPAKSDQSEVTITVGNVNRPPSLNAIGNRQVDENTLLTITVSANDLDGDSLTYEALGLPSGAAFVNQQFSWTPGFDQSGNHVVTFTVTDGSGTDSVDVTLTVGNVDRPPVLDGIGPKSIGEGAVLTFTVNATDPDGDALLYTATGIPTGAAFDPVSRTFTWTPDFTQGGNYFVGFNVTDGELSDSETVTITVGDVNRPPVLNNIGARTGTVGNAILISVGGTDPDNDVITYTAAPLPTGAQFDTVTGRFSWLPLTAGRYEIVFTATDGALSDSETVVFEISAANSNSPGGGGGGGGCFLDTLMR